MSSSSNIVTEYNRGGVGWQTRGMEEGDRLTVRKNVALNRLSEALHEASESLVTEDQRKAMEAAEQAEAEIAPVLAAISRAKVESGAYEETDPGMRVVSVREM